MAQTPPLLHENLMTDVWRLADQKTALTAQLAELEQLYREAIVLAHTFGIRQPILAKLSDVSPGRISQIVQTTDRPDVDLDEFHQAVHQVLEWPADQLHRTREALPGRQERFAEKFEIVHG
jgi:hypothetical protein